MGWRMGKVAMNIPLVVIILMSNKIPRFPKASKNPDYDYKVKQINNLRLYLGVYSTAKKLS